MAVISLEQYRQTIGSFHVLYSGTSKHYFRPCMNCHQKPQLLICAILMFSLLSVLSNDVETNPGPPMKVCLVCNASIHIRKVTCSCGYVFKKRKAVDPEVAIKQKRAKQADADCSKHKEINKLAMSKRRALESDIDALKRKKANKVAMSEKKSTRK